MTALRAEQLPVHAGLAEIYAVSVSALVAVITEMVTQTAVLEEQVKQGFGQHPDSEVYLSQPGLGQVLAARVLAEFGDDPNRYANARARNNYAGMRRSPSLRHQTRRAGSLGPERRLADALYQQAFAALTASRGYYDRQRDRGATHHQALRALGSRLVGILHGSLRHHTTYDEATAWPAEHQLAARHLPPVGCLGDRHD